jgi:hypothetical protein
MATWHLLPAALAANVHEGSPLPAARAVVVGVPAAALLIYWWVTRHRGRP